VRIRHDWFAVQAYYDSGHDRDACRRKFGFALRSWYTAIERGDLRVTDAPPKRVDWAAVQRYSDEGHTVRECRARFGFSGGAWTKAVRRCDLRPRPLATPLETILRRSRSRSTIKRRLLLAGLLQNRCEACGLSDWRGKPLAIQIDHINGIRDDFRLENLRMLCPNCHSQTEDLRRPKQREADQTDKQLSRFV
jgi:Zn finger protein HypA/HybF involved in hydrogenase expression